MSPTVYDSVQILQERRSEIEKRKEVARKFAAIDKNVPDIIKDCDDEIDRLDICIEVLMNADV